MAKKITLEGLVCENRVSEAIAELKSLIDRLSTEHADSLTQLSGRIQSVHDQIDKNTAPSESTNIENSRIRATFLHILTDVREEIQSKVNFFKPIPRAAKDRDMLRDFIHTVLSKKYTDITPFSEGNSFIYFSAKEIHSEQDVMIMVLKSSDIEEFSKSRQLQMISRLKHRNLIQLLGVNFQSYPFYIITEFVSGVNLKKLLSTTGAFPFHNAKRLAISLLEDSYYFAPEILHVHDTKALSTVEIDKANQFCLAALGFEMITGEKLFKGKNLSEVLLNRHTFFNDAVYRKARLSHPRLPSRMKVQKPTRFIRSHKKNRKQK